MTFSMLFALALFAFVNSITPGPNNVMLLASGATFGYRRSLPHMLGITAGVAIMLLLVGAGLGQVFNTMPRLYIILKYVGACYLLYLAWRIARTTAIDSAEARSKPFTFLQAAAFQWVNPKASQHKYMDLVRQWIAPGIAYASINSMFQYDHGNAVGGVALPYPDGTHRSLAR